MGNVGLLYSSKKPVNVVEMLKIVLEIPKTKEVIPTFQTYLALTKYIQSHTLLFPPTVYTEILEMAGKIKRVDGVLIHN
jgi:hypothetical protein